MDALSTFTGAWEFATDEEFGQWLGRVFPLYFHDVQNAAPVIAAMAAAPPAVAAARPVNARDPEFLVRDRLQAVVTPTRVLVGRHDCICSPVQAEILHQGNPEAQIHVFEHSGHFPWIEEPEVFVRTVSTVLHS